MSNDTKSIEELQAEFKDMKKTAFIVGFTGESGKALVKQLVNTPIFEKVLLLGRRKVEFPDEEKYKILEQRTVNFENLQENEADFAGCDVGYCCLGTTRGKAGKDGFYKVDHDYIMNTATVAQSAGCKHFHVVSSQGANPNSMFFYTKVKGQVDEKLKNVGFDRVSVYRPAFLWVDREERRFGETCARVLLAPVKWISPSAATTPIEILAKAMANDTVRPREEKWTLINNANIFKLAEGKDINETGKK